MEAYLYEWLTLAVRWLHMVTGIAWIGASFYFIWLDNHLDAPSREAEGRGIGGEIWSIHGGGFYHAEKFKLAPPFLPERLHWFKWEAYWTFISGFALLVLVYYVQADLYLIERTGGLTRWPAIVLGIGSILAGWLVYDLLCRSPLGRNEHALSAALFVLLSAAAWGLTQAFSGRAAYIHFGAILGTIMVANVFFIIIPGHREMVAAVKEGRLPDPKWGIAGKQRSVHNTYFTLPVLFVMVSNHYAMTFAHQWNWLILIGLTLAGAAVRVYFVARHKGKQSMWTLVFAAAVFAAVVALAMPRREATSAAGGFERVQSIVKERCASCHAAKPTLPGLATAPKGIAFDNADQIRAQVILIKQQVATRAMPPGNLTGMTEDERALIAGWDAAR